MAKTDLTAADLNKLTEWDTPTICNGLEHLSSEYRVKASPLSRCSVLILRYPQSLDMPEPQ